MAETEDKRPPLMQMLFDDVFLMLLLGIAIPAIFYTIWGLIELASIPLAK